MNLFENDLRASIALTDRVFAETLIPLRGVLVTAPDHSERIFGFGDVEASMRVRLLNDAMKLDLRGGVSLPFGEAGPPFDEQMNERYLLGSGTFDPIAGVQGSMPAGRDRVLGYAWVRAPFDANVFGFRAGMRAMIGVAYALERTSWSLEAGTGFYHQSAAHYEGPAHSLSAAHDDIFASGTVEVLRDSSLPLAFTLLLPLTVRVGEAAGYHSPWTFSVATHFGW